jgi:hypothetical protein
LDRDGVEVNGAASFALGKGQCAKQNERVIAYPKLRRARIIPDPQPGHGAILLFLLLAVFAMLGQEQEFEKVVGTENVLIRVGGAKNGLHSLSASFRFSFGAGEFESRLRKGPDSRKHAAPGMYVPENGEQEVEPEMVPPRESVQG